MPDLKEVDPDDAFSSIPYEKGSSLLMYLEQKLGGAGQLHCSDVADSENLTCPYDSFSALWFQIELIVFNTAYSIANPLRC